LLEILHHLFNLQEKKLTANCISWWTEFFWLSMDI